MTRFRSALAAALAASLVLLPAAAHAAPGSGTEGSVPSEVATYVADGSLVAQLNDVYGVSAAGDGIEFDETTKPGVIERVHVWSAELRAGDETEHPLDLLNEWVVPITIADQPVGLATVWINPATAAPELASFDADPDVAAALSAIPDGSSLVRDVDSAAWLALAADGTLTPLVPGTTGLSTPVPLEDVALLPPPSGDAQADGDPGTGVGLAIAVLLLLLAVIVVALVLPAARGRTQPEDAVAESEAAAGAESEASPDAPEAPPDAPDAPAIESADEPAAEAPEPPKKPAARKKKTPPPAE